MCTDLLCNLACLLASIMFAAHMHPFHRFVRDRGYQGLIVGLTGDTESEDIRVFLQQGADAVLAKPFNIRDLERIVHAYRRDGRGLMGEMMD